MATAQHGHSHSGRAGRGSLHFDEMDAIQAHSTLQEADELIHRWLAGVESSQLQLDLPVAGGEEKGDDFLSSVDWVSGDVGQSTKDVLHGLLNKELKSENESQTTSKKRSHNPLVTMEMRHKEVKRRRDLRDKKRLEKEERKKLSELAHREAKAIVMEEERKAKARAAAEERLVEQQMKALRKELRERERLTRQLALEESLVREEETVERSREEGVVKEAEKFIKSERQRVSTRMELTRQLEEAEVKETKENVRLLHQCFQSWWDEVMKGRGKLAKAAAVRDWRLVLRVWKGWVRFVRERKEKREREEVARWLTREKRMMEVAMDNYAYRILKRSLGAWHMITRQANSERKQKQARETHRLKMAALLQVATAKAEKQRNYEEQLSPTIELSPRPFNAESPAQQVTISRAMEAPAQQVTASRLSQQGSSSKQTSPVVEKSKSNKDRETNAHEGGGGESGSHTIVDKTETGGATKSKDSVTPKSSRRNIRPSGGGDVAIWRNAKKQLDELLSQVDAPPLTTPTVGVAKSLKTTHSRLHRPKPKPTTKQLAMTTAMEQRSAEITDRRLAREQRREARSREKLEQLAKEEEEQRRAEAAVKEARLKQRREERRLAKQREMEKLERQKILTEQTDKATSHYCLASLKWRGVWPWRRFVEEMKIRCHEADQLREKVLTKKTLLKWHSLTLQREEERDAIAVSHYRKSLLRNSIAAWIKVRELGCELEAMADHHCPRFLLRRIFRGWSRTVREERSAQWEKMARARRFRQRQVQYSVLKAWCGFVPLAKEERERERRRAELRRKVASWLDDYKPSSNSVNNVEQ